MLNPCRGRISKRSNQNDHHFGPLPFLPNFAIEKKAYDDEAGVNKEFVLLKLSSGGGGGGRGWMDNVVIPTVPCCHLPPPPASQQWWRRLSQTSSTSSWDGTRKKCLMSWDGRQFPRPIPTISMAVSSFYPIPGCWQRWSPRDDCYTSWYWYEQTHGDYHYFDKLIQEFSMGR